MFWNNLRSKFTWPLVISILFLLLIILYLEIDILNYTHGILVYAIDDAYIHMSIAKNIILQHVWAPSGNELISASSSILYPIILAIFFKVFGLHESIPFFINLAVALMFLIVLQRWLKKNKVDSIWQVIILLLVLFITPIPAMVTIGMEHMLQILFSFLFICAFCEYISKNKYVDDRSSMMRRIYILGLLVTSIRYEGMFLIFVSCIIMLMQKDIKKACILAVAGFFPIVIFGIYSILNNCYFFPNSVLVKSTNIPFQFNWETIIAYASLYFSRLYIPITVYHNTFSSIPILIIIIILPIVYLFSVIYKLNNNSANRYMLIFIWVTEILHLCFAKTGWFYRYEAYIISIGLIAILIELIQFYSLIGDKITKELSIAVVFLIFIFIPFFLRGFDSIFRNFGATKNIYDQNYQIGQFIHRYYDSTNIVINDLGATTFFSQGFKIDVLGLGNNEIARSIVNEGDVLNIVRDEVNKKNGKIAILSDAFPKEYYSGWTKVATWHISDAYTAASLNIIFYAIDSTYIYGLRKNIEDFSSKLPLGEKVIYNTK